MYSMTGYGKAEYKDGGIELTVELKTVNNRYLEIIAKYPRAFISLDDTIRKCIQSKLNRGRVETFITYADKREKLTSVEVDVQLAKGYVEASKILKSNFPDLVDDYTLTSLMRTQEVVTVGAGEDDLDEILPILKETILKACDNLNLMREKEGLKLKEDLLGRVEVVKSIVDKISLRAPAIKEEYRKKLTERVESYLQDVKPDETRLLQEVALFADKSNIDEELTRLYSHVAQFKEIIEEQGAGKKLDFLVQEFNREANTICSKANDIAVTGYGLDLKCEIEKIREQIQNIE